ncbi:MAG: ribose 5-phosphate isomerase A [Coriobacteriia bacterium]|nr:ribose 5-phosphate isomerase A [Coriobacteriia bacterium]
MPGDSRQKRAAARAALAFVKAGEVIGIGSGSTVDAFVDVLAAEGPLVSGAVAASGATAGRLLGGGIRVLSLAQAGGVLGVYVDGADRVDPRGRAIKGGGGAHTREKELASVASLWVCIVDASKFAESLDGASVPLEVEPGFESSVAQVVTSLGGDLYRREQAFADSGYPLYDVVGFDLSDPLAAEDALDAIPGVVECGIFAHRTPDVVLIASEEGILSIRPGGCQTP